MVDGGNINKQNARMKTHECRRLHLCCMELDRDQTRGLVAALESGVEDAVVLGHGGALTLHIETPGPVRGQRAGRVCRLVGPDQSALQGTGQPVQNYEL